VPVQEAVAPVFEADAPAQAVASQSTAGPEEDPADLFEPPPEPPAAAGQATIADEAPVEAAAPMEPAQPAEPTRAVPPPPMRAIPRPPLSDPLAAVRDLSASRCSADAAAFCGLYGVESGRQVRAATPCRAFMSTLLTFY